MSGLGLPRAAAIVGALFTTLTLAGCAHNIVISTTVPPYAGAAKSERVIGVYVAPADKQRVTTTAASGGDRVSYTLAKDLEYPLFRELSAFYKDVVMLNSPDDHPTIEAKGISLIFQPTFTSQSSGSSFVYWMPDKFAIQADCKVTDPMGQLVWEGTLSGNGTATSSEALKTFGLAANRAAQELVLKVRQELHDNPALR